MAATTFNDLRALVYRRLGDRQYQASATTGGTAAHLDAVDAEINNAIGQLVREAELRGARPLSDSGTISVVSGTREYDLDTDLKDSAGTAKNNYRAHLFIERTDLTEPVNVRWAKGGDYRMREYIRRGLTDSYLVTEELTGTDLNLAGDVPYLYLRDDRTVGYVDTPTAAQTLTCYYSPLVTPLVNGSDKLEDIGLKQFESWSNLIAYVAALVLHADIASPTYEMMVRQHDVAWRRFVTSIHAERRPALIRRRGRWSA